MMEVRSVSECQIDHEPFFPIFQSGGAWLCQSSNLPAGSES